MATLFGVVDHNPPPALAVAPRGGLLREANAFDDDVALDRAREVQTPAHSPRRRKQLVDGFEIELAHSGLLSLETTRTEAQPVRW